MAKTWNGKIDLNLFEIEDVEEGYRQHGSPVIREDKVSEDVIKLAKRIKVRRPTAAVVLGAIIDGRAPKAEITLGASFESIFFGGVMRKVASMIERQLDHNDIKELQAGRDGDGREIWEPTETELGDKFYRERAEQALGTAVNAAYAHEINGHGGGSEFLEELFSQVRQGFENKLESESEKEVV